MLDGVSTRCGARASTHMSTVQSAATVSRLEKVAVDNGFDRELGREGGWLCFASSPRGGLVPPNLRKAHHALDRAVDRLYRRPRFASGKARRSTPPRRPAALVRGSGQAYALQTVEPVTYRCGTRRVCQARSSGSERYTRARPHAVAPMNCVPEDSRRRSTCTGRTHSPRALADGNQTPSSTVAVRAPSPS